MAQTTTSISGSNLYVAVSTDGAAWNDISGSITKISAPAFKRKTGTAWTPGTDTAIVTYGPMEPVTVTVTALFTKTAGEAWARLRTQFQTAGGGRMDLRWAPNGNVSGELQYTSGSAKIMSLDFPDGDGGGAGPILVSAQWLIASITESTIP